jgi:hypothetical protein
MVVIRSRGGEFPVVNQDGWPGLISTNDDEGQFQIRVPSRFQPANKDRRRLLGNVHSQNGISYQSTSAQVERV